MTSHECLFCRIVSGEEPAWVVAQNDSFIASLTPFPNTPGFTVVATKEHLDSYIFHLEDSTMNEMFRFARRVGLALDAALGCARTGLIAEGMGVVHAHIKLIPMHGIPDPWASVTSDNKRYSPIYEGFLTSQDGPRQNSETLTELQTRIRAAIDLGNDTANE